MTTSNTPSNQDDNNGKHTYKDYKDFDTGFRFQITLEDVLSQVRGTDLEAKEHKQGEHVNDNSSTACQESCMDEAKIKAEARVETKNQSPKSTIHKNVPQAAQDVFYKHGFIMIPNVLDHDLVDALQSALVNVLNGQYGTGYTRPDKISPKTATSCSLMGNNHQNNKASNNTTPLVQTRAKKNKKVTSSPSKKVIQIVNIHKSNALFRAVATNPILGNVIFQLVRQKWFTTQNEIVQKEKDKENDKIKVSSATTTTTVWSQGVRLASDQIWAKPPAASTSSNNKDSVVKAKGLAFHQDTPYFFMLDPSHAVITVWITLDDLFDADLGPLEYIAGSHQWEAMAASRKRQQDSQQTDQDNDKQKFSTVGAPRQFFSSSSQLAPNNKNNNNNNNNGLGGLVQRAAAAAGASLQQQPKNNHETAHNINVTTTGDATTTATRVTTCGLPRGSIAIHYGTTWHGSGPNQSMVQPRRGYGIHFVPAHTTLVPEKALKSQLWKDHVVVADASRQLLSLQDCPIVFFNNNQTQKDDDDDNNELVMQL